MSGKHRVLILVTVLFMLAHSFASASADQKAGGSLKNSLKELDYIYKNRNYDECIKFADGLLKENPTLIGALTYKALSFFKQKNYPEAERTYNEILKYNSLHSKTLYNLACVYSLQNKQDEAISCLKKLVALDVTNKRGIKIDNDFYNIRENIVFKNIAGITVRVGGEVLFFDVLPRVENGRTLVPMRLIFEALGADVVWDEKTMGVLAKKEDVSVSLTVGSDVIYINGEEARMDARPVLEEGRVLVPLRFVAEALDAKVSWNGRDEIIDIVTKAPEGGVKYSYVKERFLDLTDVIVVEGGSVQPYGLAYGQVKTMIVAKSKEALELLNSMSFDEREKYFSEYENPEFIYKSRAYYRKQDDIITYFENGILANVVVLDEDGLNFRDYY